VRAPLPDTAGWKGKREVRNWLICLPLFLQPEHKYVDPICTFFFSILVLGTTLTILRDVILVLMEGNLDFGAPF
jgi:hypothetical protein